MFRILLLFAVMSSPVFAQNAGFALRFDGQDDSIQIPDSPALSGGVGKSITVEAWVKVKNLKKDRPVIQKWLDTQSKEWGLTIDGSDNHEVSVAIERQGTNFEYKVAGGVIQPETWHHIAMSFDWQTAMLRIFVDGIEYGPGASVPGGMPDTRARVLIGRHAYTDDKHFLGEIDEIRIWDFARSAEELRQTMSGPLTGQEAGLVAFWNLDEGSGTQINDLAGNHDGEFEQDEASGPQWVISTVPFAGSAFIAVESPNGGEILTPGSTHSILWTAVGVGPEVRVEFSDNAGQSWQVERSATANDGKFGWTVPDQLTSFGLIRLTDLSDPTIRDISDASFTVSEVPIGELSFEDITGSAGTGGPTGSGNTGGHAAIWADVDSDGYPDLYHTMLFTKGMPDLFFRNLGNNTFAEEGELRGIDDFDKGSHGAVWADLDNDGDYDLWNGTTTGLDGEPAVNNLYRNDGNGFFTDVTASAGIPGRDWPTRGVTAFDMDNDGDLDLVAITNFEGTADPADERNEVYRNDGNMHFTRIDQGDIYTAPAAQGVTAADFDNDGDLDLVAGNRTGPLNIFRNNGNGSFTRISPASVGINQMGREGVTFGDVNNDGWLDILLSDYDEANDYAIERLYLNRGDGAFSNHQLFKRTHGYMGAFADLDNDGDLDLVFAGDSQCYLNDGSGNFSDGPSVPTDGIDDPRAIGCADFDNDGDMDLAIGAKRSRNWLVRNNYDTGYWLKLELVSPQGQAGAFGAKVRMYRAGDLGGDLIGFREARGANGYLGQNDPVLHFGLGGHPAVDVEVEFPDGTILARTQVAANQRIILDAFNAPRISDFSPTVGIPGTEVTLHGRYLLNATEVTFGSVAANFTVISDRQIVAVVPLNAATGLIAVTNNNGTGRSTGSFTVLGAPEPVVYLPTDDAQVKVSAPDENYGDKTTFKVERDDFLSYLKFDVSDVGGGVREARLRLHVVGGSSHAGEIIPVANTFAGSSQPWQEAALTFRNAPTLSAEPVADIGAVEAGEWVEFDVTAAISQTGTFSFALRSRESDQVEYSSKEGEFAPELTLMPLPSGPRIDSFNPARGTAGTQVTISGGHFTFVESVAFGAAAANFTVVSNSVIRATVPEGAGSGPIVVSSPLGTAVSATDFIVMAAPEIRGFEPQSGFAGTEVAIRGKYLTPVTTVKFGDIESQQVAIKSDTLLTATAPPGAVTAAIAVSSEFGAAASAGQFTVMAGRQFNLAPLADAFVRSSEPNTHFGKETELQTSRSPASASASYLKFEIRGVTGEIARAELRLHVLDASNDGGAIYLAENTYPHSDKPWRETSVSWTTAPAITTLPLAILGAVSAGQSVTLDLTGVIRENGVYTLVVKNNSPDRAAFAAREHNDGPKLMVVEVTTEQATPLADNNPDQPRRTPLPLEFALFPNYPNPFNGETVLQYALPTEAEVELAVYNIRGQLVRLLVREFQTAGVKRAVWDGRNDDGVTLASGVYFVRMLAPGRMFVGRVSLQK